MRGKSVFYPMGWDDNGLPTERRVQNHFGVRCDPSLPYDPDFTPPEKPDPEASGLDQQAQLRRAVRTAGGARTSRSTSSCGARWACRSTGRTTTRPSVPRPSWPASARSCATSRAARPTSRRRRPSGTSPSRPRSPRPSSRRATTPAPTTGSHFHRPERRPVPIETTRPELIPSVVALIAHPDDERYQPLFGTTRHLARSSASRSPSSRIRRPRWTRAPASPCAARSVTSPTSPGGASWTCRSAP